MLLERIANRFVYGNCKVNRAAFRARASGLLELALDLAGRLWTARDLSLTGFAALATLLFARTCSALALREELG